MEPGGLTASRLSSRCQNEILSSIPYFRVAFVGNRNSGKSEVRRAYVQLTSKPGGAEQIDANTIKIQDHQVELLAVDTVAEFARIPHMIRCNHLDAIIVFYNVNNLKQFESVHHNWIPAIKRLYPGAPFIICATGIDCRTERKDRVSSATAQVDQMFASSSSKALSREPTRPSKKPAASPLEFHKRLSTHYQKFITTEMGYSLSKEMGASSFQEVSAKTFENISALMDVTMDVILQSEVIKLSLTRHGVGHPKPDEACRQM